MIHYSLPCLIISVSVLVLYEYRDRDRIVLVTKRSEAKRGGDLWTGSGHSQEVGEAVQSGDAGTGIVYYLLYNHDYERIVYVKPVKPLVVQQQVTAQPDGRSSCAAPQPSTMPSRGRGEGWRRSRETQSYSTFLFSLRCAYQAARPIFTKPSSPR